MITNNKLIYYTDRVLGEHKPITADIFLTNYCNNKCPYCTYGRWDLKSDGAKYMKFEDFKTYAEKLVSMGVDGFILTGGGEPTINKDFDKIVNYLETTNLQYGINTNFNVLKYIKPTYLKVSLDAWDNASYQRKRGVPNYDIVRDNITKYASWKRVNSPRTMLGIQLLANSVQEVYNFYDGNKDLDVDYIVIRPIESTNGKYYKELDTKEFNYSKNSIVKAILELGAKDKRVQLNYKWNMLDTEFDYCIANWTQIALNENGDVMYCCHKPYQIIGHIMDNDILEKKEKATTNMSMCDIPCRLSGVNATALSMLKPPIDRGFI